MSLLDMIDPAILRPGRLDKVLYVGLPTLKGRLSILSAITKASICCPVCPLTFVPIVISSSVYVCVYIHKDILCTIVLQPVSL